MATVTFHGHSCVEIHHNEHRLIIDPFLSANPKATRKPEDIRVGFVLLTHGHFDHWGDTEQIAKANNAVVISMVEVATLASSLGLKSHGLNLGGGFEFPFGRVQLTIAHHSSGGGESGLTYLGHPAGLLITLAGKTLYHAGDTALTYDLKLLGEFHAIDLALLPIGDNFTMGIDDAVRATNFVSPRRVVPIHYDTFDLIAADDQEFARRVRKDTRAEPVIMAVGDTLEL